VQVVIFGLQMEVDEVIPHELPAMHCPHCTKAGRMFVNVRDSRGSFKICWRCLVASKRSGEARPTTLQRMFEQAALVAEEV
jgi:hypothetical protein